MVGETIVHPVDLVSDVGDVLRDLGQLLCVLFVFRSVDVAGFAGLIDNPDESQTAYKPGRNDLGEIHVVTRISRGARCR